MDSKLGLFPAATNDVALPAIGSMIAIVFGFDVSVVPIETKSLLCTASHTMSFGTDIPATVLTHVFPVGGRLIVKLSALDAPLLGFESVTFAVPAAAKSEAGIVAVSAAAVLHEIGIRLMSTQDVTSEVPFHSIATLS